MVGLRTYPRCPDHTKCAGLRVERSGSRLSRVNMLTGPINVTGELSEKPDEMLGSNLAMDWHPIQVGVVILLVAPCEGNSDTIRLDGPQFL